MHECVHGCIAPRAEAHRALQINSTQDHPGRWVRTYSLHRTQQAPCCVGQWAMLSLRLRDGGRKPPQPCVGFGVPSLLHVRQPRNILLPLNLLRIKTLNTKTLTLKHTYTFPEKTPSNQNSSATARHMARTNRKTSQPACPCCCIPSNLWTFGFFFFNSKRSSRENVSGHTEVGHQPRFNKLFKQ